MNIPSTIAALTAAGVGLAVVHAAARPLHHHRHHAYHRPGRPPYAFRAPRLPYGYQAPYGYGYGGGPRFYPGGPYGAQQIIENATVRAQHEPGVTSELAPDAKQTATGGPSGGVPGFSGF